MRKFMKYEIRGTYKFILGILVIVLLASTIIQFNIANEIKAFDLVARTISFMKFMFVIAMFVIFGAFITAFFYIVGSFRKELYEDTGYLTFTLPLTGTQILGGKLLVALFWYGFLALGTAIYNLILATILFGADWLEIVREAITLVNTSGVISIFFISILGTVTTLILIYFSIALSKVSIKNKKVGGLWFILFLILNGITGYIVSKVGSALPHYFDITSFKILSKNETNMLFYMNSMTGMIGSQFLLGNNQGIAYINIWSTLTQILIAVMAFLGTGYLIEKRIDL